MVTTMATASPPQVGQKAPEFTLLGTLDRTKPWSLHEALGKGPVVVAFMPGAFTSTCTKESCHFTATLNDYAKLGAQVVGVTVDSRPALVAWAARDDIKIPLLSDFEKRTIRTWGLVWASNWGDVAKRATFVVDRGGVIRYAKVHDDADDEPDYAEIQKALEGLK